MQARPMPVCRHVLSVRLSVTFVNFVKTSRLIMSSKIIHRQVYSQTILVFPYQTSFYWAVRCLELTATIIRHSDGDPPNGGVECKSQFWTNSWLSIDGCCSARSTIGGRRSVVYHIYGARLFTAKKPPRISDNAEEREKNRTEQNFFLRSGKSESEITNN